MRINRNVERIWTPSVAQSRSQSGVDALLVGWLAQSGQKLARPPVRSLARSINLFSPLAVIFSMTARNVAPMRD